MQSLTAAHLKEMLDREEDVHLIDVLPRASFAKRQLPGAVNVSQYDDSFLERIATLVGDKDATIVVYCVSKSCNASMKAAQKLVEAGYANVFDFEGGVKEWEAAGYPRGRGAGASR